MTERTSARPRGVGDLVPSTTLHAVDGTTVRLRWAPHGTVLVVAVRRAAPGDRDGLAGLDERGAHLDDWGARAVVLADGAAGRLAGTLATPVVDDAGGRLRDRLGLPADARCAAAVVDRFGQVWRLTTAADPGGLPLDALEETARFVGVQCPECEVPDVPPAGLATDGA